MGNQSGVDKRSLADLGPTAKVQRFRRHLQLSQKLTRQPSPAQKRLRILVAVIIEEFKEILSSRRGRLLRIQQFAMQGLKENVGFSGIACDDLFLGASGRQKSFDVGGGA